jgi:hypothetical protein
MTGADPSRRAPRALRWLREFLSLAVIVVLAVAFPRIDRWPQANLWPLYLVAFLFLPGLWTIHRERLLGRGRRRQLAAYLATLGYRAIGIGLFVPLSLTLGAEWGESPFQRLMARLPNLQIPLWAIAVGLFALALLRYRLDKKEEAKLRAQAAAERGVEA